MFSMYFSYLIDTATLSGKYCDHLHFTNEAVMLKDIKY